MTDPSAPPGSAGRAPWPRIPGPADRETFFAAQRRHRRAAVWLSALSALAAVLLGVVFSFVLSPAVILLWALGLRLAGLVVSVPAVAWDVLRPLVPAYAQLRVVFADVRLSSTEVRPAVEAIAILLIPGVVAIVLLWLVLGALTFRAGVGGILLSLGARAPRGDDPEERQLVNVVDEMAIAAGLPPPRTMLLDGDGTNAAVLGSSPADATIVVSRRLLDVLDRDETQGVLGHLVASAGNGDLRILLAFLSVAHTLGVLMALLDAPLSRRARIRLRRVLAVLLFGWTRRAAGPLADRLGAALMTGLSLDAVSDTLESLDATDRPTRSSLVRLLRHVRFFLLLPVILLSLEGKLLMFLFTLFVVGPMTWTMLRRRRYLADATAVQLTRNPDGLARALMVLEEQRRDVRGAGSAEPLFVIGAGPRGGGSAFVLLGAQPPVPGRVTRLIALGASVRPPASREAAPAPATAAPAPIEAAPAANTTGGGIWSLVIGLPIVALIVIGVGVLLVYGAGFVLYLLAVGVIAALVVIAGVYVAAMEILLRLLP